MELIEEELRRIYAFDQARWDMSNLNEFSEDELQTWNRMPEEIRFIASFIGCEETFPGAFNVLYGPHEIVQWNGPDGAFGQLSVVLPDYPYDTVVKFGEDAFYDPDGQLGPARGVYKAIGHDLAEAKLVADTLLALLHAAGTYRK